MLTFMYYALILYGWRKLVYPERMNTLREKICKLNLGKKRNTNCCHMSMKLEAPGFQRKYPKHLNLSITRDVSHYAP